MRNTTCIIPLLLLLLLPGINRAQEIVVSAEGTVTTLSEAISRADSGDTITLTPGIYRERNVVIDKPLTLRGESNAIIDAEGKGYVLIVRADNVTIRDLQVQNAGKSFIEDYAGILVEKSRNCLIENVKLVENFFGIYLAETTESTIRNNSVTSSAERESSSGNGIHLWYSTQITVEGNTVAGHRDGIYFEFVENSDIRNNQSRKNLRYGLHFMFSDSCRYSNNIFENNGAGVAVMFTDRVEMTNNVFRDNWGSAAYGLLLKEIYDSRIENNRFENNSVGIYMEACNRQQITGNEFANNGWAIKLMANSMDNRFSRNNFMGNTFEVATNSRQNFNTFENNYWSQYEGYDLDRDGIGDVPHRPVRLFSLMVEKEPQTLVLLHSLLVKILDMAERLMPSLTPETLVDSNPQMQML
ncbi:MAG: nitrous oxide reductase family maturation protein NosD [Balneolaceae bacterium]|nr:nitrous oxide reductase family maturation protein NosD [Balneolaceae bacterium]